MPLTIGNIEYSDREGSDTITVTDKVTDTIIEEMNRREVIKVMQHLRDTLDISSTELGGIR